MPEEAHLSSDKLATWPVCPRRFGKGKRNPSFHYFKTTFKDESQTIDNSPLYSSSLTLNSLNQRTNFHCFSKIIALKRDRLYCKSLIEACNFFRGVWNRILWNLCYKKSYGSWNLNRNATYKWHIFVIIMHWTYQGENLIELWNL